MKLRPDCELAKAIADFAMHLLRSSHTDAAQIDTCTVCGEARAHLLEVIHRMLIRAHLDEPDEEGAPSETDYMWAQDEANEIMGVVSDDAEESDWDYVRRNCLP